MIDKLLPNSVLLYLTRNIFDRLYAGKTQPEVRLPKRTGGAKAGSAENHSRPLLDQLSRDIFQAGFKSAGEREAAALGRLFPRKYSLARKGIQPYLNQTECLLQGGEGAPALDVTVRFLQFRLQTTSSEAIWQSVEREVKVTIGTLATGHSKQAHFPFAFSEAGEMPSIEGAIEMEATPVGENVFKISVQVVNQSAISPAQCADPSALIQRIFASTHTILQTTEGSFISSLNGPAGCQCKNIRTFPVTVGMEQQILVASPMPLPDHPTLPHPAARPRENFSGSMLQRAA